MPSKKAPKPASIYVGRKDDQSFVRTYEEPNEPLAYEVFTSVRLPTRKSYPQYDIVIGPFKSLRGAEMFRDVSGIDNVEEAELR